MSRMSDRKQRRRRIKRRYRDAVRGTSNRPRLTVFRSLRHLYAQVIDDDRGVTLASASTLDKQTVGDLSSTCDLDAGKRVGEIIAERAKAWRFAAIVTIGSVLGGIAGYFIGYALFDQIGLPVLEFYGMGAKFQQFADNYNEYGAWIVFTAGVTPFPYKVITIASGVTGLSFMVFLVASIAARALVFFVIAGLLYAFGQPIRNFIEKRLGLMFTIFLVLLFGGFVAIKYLIH